MSEHRWKGKTIIICGASAGLGESFARELAALGAEHLVLLARSNAPLAALRAELLENHSGLKVDCHAVDMCNTEEVKALAPHLPEATIDLVIQAVGRSDRGSIQELSAQHLEELFAANVISSLNALHCFLPYLKRPGGAFVLIGSLASRFAPRYLGGYAIAKHALAALAQQARLELSEQGIHVLLACPGPIARQDAGRRYVASGDTASLPASVQQPGGGAKLTGLDAQQLVHEILHATARRKPELMRPHKTRLLHIVSAIAPRFGDYLLRRNSS